MERQMASMMLNPDGTQRLTEQGVRREGGRSGSGSGSGRGLIYQPGTNLVQMPPLS